MGQKLLLRACAAVGIFLFIACGRENPSTIDNPRPSVEALRPSPTIPISTVAEFDSAWDEGHFTNGTVFLIEANSVLQFASDKTYGEAAADGKSFSLIGVDTTAILKKVDPETALFALGGAGVSEVVIEDIKFLVELTPQPTGNHPGFVTLANYRGIFITNTVIDVEDQSFNLTADSLVIDGLHLRTRRVNGLLHNCRNFHAFDHTIKNSTFYRKDPGAGAPQGPCSGAFPFSPGGDVTWENNQFYATPASDGEPFYSIQENTTPIDFIFDTNNFRKQTLRFVSCRDATANVALIDNNSDLIFCSDGIGTDELIECADCDDPDDNFDVVVTVNQWSFEGDPLDYDDFGPISGQNACWDATDIVYVEFALATIPEFEEHQDVPVVEWGDDNCTTGGGTVNATWNPSTNKWNASFDVSAIGDADVYWRGTATLCEKTVVGDCIRRRFTLCGAGGIPTWFTQE